jgi:hypothetical protein
VVGIPSPSGGGRCCVGDTGADAREDPIRARAAEPRGIQQHIEPGERGSDVDSVRRSSVSCKNRAPNRAINAGAV